MKKHKESADNSVKSGSAVKRREFIRGAGLAAAAAIGGLSPGDALAHAPGLTLIGRQSLDLRYAPAVMIWRGVTGDHCKALIKDGMGWPLLGENPAVLMYDAGGVIAGFSIQPGPKPDGATAAAPASYRRSSGSASTPLAARRAGQREAEEPILGCHDNPPTVAMGSNNLASEIALYPASFRESVERLGAARERSSWDGQTVRTVFDRAAPKTASSPIKTRDGSTLPFLDNDGNLFSLNHLSGEALNSKAGLKVRSLIAKRNSSERASLAAKPANPMVGITLFVSNLSRSKEFYKEMLGLRVLESGKNEAKFDVGSLVLTLRTEPTSGLVHFLAKSGRLGADVLAFYTGDIEALAAALASRGVSFGGGIHKSPIGKVTYFPDPDGHSLGLWMPSGQHKGIDFYPALTRILNETGTAS